MPRKVFHHPSQPGKSLQHSARLPAVKTNLHPEEKPRSVQLSRKRESILVGASYRLRHTNRQFANSFSRGSEYGVGDGGRSTRHSGLSDSTRFLAIFHNVGLYLRTLVHAHQWEGVEVRLLQTSTLVRKLLE